MKLPFEKFALIFVLLLSSVVFVSAQTDTEKGIELYNKGDYQNAVQILKRAAKQNKKDVNAWYYLGWSSAQIQDVKASRKAFKEAADLNPQDARPLVGLAYVALLSDKLDDAEDKAKKAVALAPNESRAYYFLSVVNYRKGKYETAEKWAEKAIETNPNFSDSYWAKVLAKFSDVIGDGGLEEISSDLRTRMFDEAMATLESYPNLSENNAEAGFVRNKIDTLKMFQRYFVEPSLPTNIPATIPPPDPTVTPIKFISKPQAHYTDAARKNGVSGNIRLAVLFAANGAVEYVLPLRGLKNGLNEEAMKAAYSIKFQPQMKNGKPVSVIKIVEYSFSVF
ncbi:MAG: tetratricopeptide repeat protein [Acidobacteria bacterium]|nr:tetratricopeptide repeat protein [Acidobacteriota bacterium]